MSVTEIQRMIGNALARIRRPFRGIIHRVKHDAPHPQVQVSGLDGETIEAEMMQQYGISSNPPAGTRAVVLPLGGATAHGVIVATESAELRIQPLQAGETVVYNARGDYIKIGADGCIEIHCNTLKIVAPEGVDVDTPNFKISGNLVAQEVFDQGGAKSMSGMRSTHNVHTHKFGGSGPPNQSM